MFMLPSFKVSVAFLGVFLIGGVVGGLVVNTYYAAGVSHFFATTNDPVAMAARINQKYNSEYQLTPDEQARTNQLVRQMTQRLYEQRRQFGVDILATLDDYHQKIGEMMTPEHRALYEKANAARKTRMSAMLLPDPLTPDDGKK